ncbi:Long-chain-fatty-acid--CoA ligase [Mycolicibacterium vanbaalenii]|uniref:Long-chain-fatty-acid--CoA ligase n=1 Tax=Mycolicibacterium vanbaalenii TaxID=110539 RepID=A0A5S9RA58_MYCVN|nr:class I adenylate-forming enzyme family protein [Mycolicibacterium vanbaalenii]CAA0134755.1 Long-chain-fatty-acid--CoA ligase [Mycolicibacterium vanbaalenii]
MTACGAEARGLLEVFAEYRGSWIDLAARHRYPAAELRRGAAEVTRWLADWGVGGADHVVLSAANSPVLLALFMGLLQHDAVPILVHADTPAYELQRIASRAHADAIITQRQSPEALSVGGMVADRHQVLPWLDFAAGRSPAPEGHDGALRGVYMHCTSGTTGRPKLAVRTGTSAVADGHSYLATLGFDRHDTVLAAPPMTHVYGFGMCVVTPLLNHSQVVTLDRYHPRTVARAIEEYGVSILPAVPGMLESLLASYSPTTPVPTWTFTAGAPLPHELARKHFEYTSRWPYPMYGTTETALISVARTQEQAEQPNTVGVAAEGVDIRLCPATEPAFETMLVRSPMVMAGYFDEDGLDSSSVEQSWYRTGDLVSGCPDGSYLLAGRESEIINVNGLKVVPREVEDVIAAIPGVSAVKAYGKSAASDSEQVNVAVVADEQVSSATIAAHCRAHLVFYKRPNMIHLLDTLPMTPSGKVVTCELP